MFFIKQINSKCIIFFKIIKLQKKWNSFFAVFLYFFQNLSRKNTLHDNKRIIAKSAHLITKSVIMGRNIVKND